MASSPLLDTTIVQAHDCQNDVDDDHDVEKTNRSSAHLLDIALASAFVAIPVIGIVIGLLAIINSHRVPESDIFLLSDQLAQGSCSQPSFQIAFSATTLTFLASLLSTFAAYVAVPFMFLLSFRIARSLKQKSDEVAPDLPTPYQTSLLISLIGGNVGSLWSWTRYVTRSRRKRVSSPSNELSLATYSLSCLLALGLLCQLSDAWFHKATQTIIFTHIGPTWFPALALSRDLSTKCSDLISSGQLMIINLQPGPADRLPCTLTSADQSYSLSNPSEGYKLAQGISLLNNITTISSSKTSISILLPSNPHPDLDWRAKTIGVTTQCENIATKCMNPSGSIGFSNQEFNCSKSVGFPSEFSGKMGIHQGGTMWNWTLFPNALPENTSSIEYNLPNPYNFVLQAVGTEKPQDKLTKDPDMIVRDNFVSNTILKCNTTIYDVVYTSINGTITIEDHHSSNLNISQSINGPTIFSLLFAHPEQASLPSFVKSGFSTALFSSESAIEMAQRFANIYSRITLAFGSVALNPLETLVQQTRATSLVTCVPKAPLFALVGLAGLYLALAIILAVIAVRNTSGDVADIQSQLSISGLAATRFESTGSADDNSGGSGGNIEDIFEEFRGEFRKGETKRVAFTKQMGIGWEYTVVKA